MTPGSQSGSPLACSQGAEASAFFPFDIKGKRFKNGGRRGLRTPIDSCNPPHASLQLKASTRFQKPHLFLANSHFQEKSSLEAV